MKTLKKVLFIGLMAFIVCLGIAAIILLAFALCRVSAHADRAASRHERERNQPS